MGDPVTGHGSDQVTLVSSRGPVVYVDDMDHPDLASDDLHHLQRVVRLRQGDALVVCDGRGWWRPAHPACSAHGRAQPGEQSLLGLRHRLTPQFGQATQKLFLLIIEIVGGLHLDMH